MVVDGCWSTRSYGHKYSSLSGCACIVSHHTRKLLYLGVRNKFCWSCAHSKKTGVMLDHKCYLNHSGPSTAMEADIICDGFRFYEQFGLRFMEVIGDDDSSVYKKIRESITYGGMIQKKLCANHVVRNFTSRLFALQSNRTLCSIERKALSNAKLKAMKIFSRKCISICHRKELTEYELKQQFYAIPEHVFGTHGKCDVNFCNDAGSAQLSQLSSYQLYMTFHMEGAGFFVFLFT